ncbi:hypothetical protein PseudUWO311_00635 [Pseudanabaena sp. UWO311]|uniref:hypothetical protein n=1 Tax=Pseudanabaena sp. UWO311 TaxID=2487337 RepID=UPI00115A48B2|nr:hypothetical protein [Pseudanabaena sp. UWO311]TYQ29437.1 hypothetical protein PseudUWO311_00635 [Pseudanabaena sp. UWO311]
MYTIEKARLNLTVSNDADDKLRELALKHRKSLTLSEIVEEMIHHCVHNPNFIEKLTKKEEIDR